MDKYRDLEKRLRMIADNIWNIGKKVSNEGSNFSYDDTYLLGEEIKRISSQIHSIASEVGESK